MRDDRIRHARCFVWITRWIGRCKAIIKEKFGSTWILHHDANVTDLISTTEAMESETILWRKRRIGGRSTWVVHHHTQTETPSTMNLWTDTPSFPLDGSSPIKTKNFFDFCQEHDRPLSPYLPMTSSMRYSFFDVFDALRSLRHFQWKRWGL